MPLGKVWRSEVNVRERKIRARCFAEIGGKCLCFDRFGVDLGAELFYNHITGGTSNVSNGTT
jgi:hypothetical protein